MIDQPQGLPGRRGRRFLEQGVQRRVGAGQDQHPAEIDRDVKVVARPGGDRAGHRQHLLTQARQLVPILVDESEQNLPAGLAGLAVGQDVTVEALEGIKAVDVTGLTKGRGYSGAMKRHGFAGQRASHGVKKVHRHMGGTGALAANRGGGRPKKGKKMPGQYGHEQVTIRNMKLVRVDKENNLLLINGAVPGPNGAYLVVRETNKVT